MTTTFNSKLRRTINYKHTLALTIAIVFVSIIWISALVGKSGVRGTDQYWYLGDVATLVSKAPPLTNIYYPGSILRDTEVDDTTNYFLHNGPLLHLVAGLAKSGSEYTTWITVNVLSHLLVAVSIFLIAIKYTNASIATYASCFYLVSPIATWQTLNMLQEQFLAGLIAIILLCYAYHHRLINQAILICTLIVGILSHPLFFVLAMLYCLAEISITLVSVEKTVRSYSKIASALAMLVLFVATKSYADQIFPNTFQPNLTTIIGGAIPGKTNMLWHFSDMPLRVDTSLLFSKLKAAVNAHFITPRDVPLYVFTNISFLCALFLLLFRAKKNPDILWPCLLCVGLYLAIILLMQTQARYQQIVAPASFLLIALCAYELEQKLANKLFQLLAASLFIGSLVLSTYMLHTVIKQSTTQSAALKLIQDKFGDMTESDTLLLLDSQYELFLSYAFAPRKVLIVQSPLISIESRDKAISMFNPDYVVTTKKGLTDNLSPTESDHIEIDQMGSVYRFKIANR